MKKFVLLSLLSLVCFGCNGQEKESEEKKEDQSLAEQPKGSWKVNREFDENGNLIRYDSIYSWSSSEYMDDLAQMDRDSLLESFRSRFSRSFSHFNHNGFPNFFEEDSLFTKHFFEDDFFESPLGKDFMDLDKIQKRMEAMQRKFLEQYAPNPDKEENEQL
ncbi:hypothetical protein [Muricauda sp. MAR_2010_75]|uniref:hypothetical protein n=1 Tax=Allomuricauda sp. MAR_2010_75 TaxID=1250232 RepID=UPI0005682048|nr:hypothetical protein [Muricauda sp. MAR_2010_75]